MAVKIVKALVVGACFGVLGYIIFKDIAWALILGAVWFAAMMTGKKQS